MRSSTNLLKMYKHVLWKACAHHAEILGTNTKCMHSFCFYRCGVVQNQVLFPRFSLLLDTGLPTPKYTQSPLFARTFSTSSTGPITNTTN